MAKIQHLKEKWEQEKPKNNAQSRRRQAELKPIEGFGPLVMNMRAFLAASKAAGSPWMMFSFSEEDGDEDNEDGEDDGKDVYFGREVGGNDDGDEDEGRGEEEDVEMFGVEEYEDGDLEMTG